MSGTMRLDRLLGNLGYGSRREIEMMARAGLVVLDGRKVTKADSKIALTPDLPARMRVGGEAVDPPPGLVLMVHKPLGVTCSHKEAGRRVYDLLPARWQRREPAISTVGRLDKETSGLLLMTDDGALLHRIISPKHHVPKRYLVTTARPIGAEVAAVFAGGTLVLEGEAKPLLPAEMEVLGERQAVLTLHEGRYHQVRRMFAAIGNHVEALHRDRVGALALPDDLAPGDWRLLGEAELAAVFAG